MFTPPEMSRLTYCLGLKSPDYPTLHTQAVTITGGVGAPLFVLTRYVNVTVLWNKTRLTGRHLTFCATDQKGSLKLSQITSFCFCTVSTKPYVHHTRKIKT